jgi:tRNA(fMet)-specific endonuclease VapC
LTQSFRYLLDTNTLSDLIRQPQGSVAKRISAVGEETICTSIIVAAELRFGADKSDSKKLANRVDLILSAMKSYLWNHQLIWSMRKYKDTHFIIDR